MTRRFRLRAVLALAGTALWFAACERSEPTHPQDPAATPRVEAPARTDTPPTAEAPARADAAPPADVPPVDPVLPFRYPSPTAQPWARAQAYLDGLRWADDGDEGRVRLCNACGYASLRVRSEARVLDLPSGSVGAAPRVIARLDVLDGAPAGPLGLAGAGAAGERYLLVLDDTSAVAFWDADGYIAFSSPWRLKQRPDEVAAAPQARFRSDPHPQAEAHGEGSFASFRPVLFEHLSGVWVACPDGCCFLGPADGH